MWLAILGSLFAAFVAGIVYISFKSARFPFVLKLCRQRKHLARILCLVMYILLTVVLYLIWGIMNAVVCMLHLVVFWLICDLAAFIISKIRHKKSEKYRSGAIAAVLCVLYLIAGWIAEHHVWQTDYTFTTQKAVGSIRVVQITDSHLGTTFDAGKFSEYIEKINGLSPDVVVITGDFADDGTSREDMTGGCEALGRLKTKYGVYFVYGNHDRGYYSAARRGWSNEQMRSCLTENGVHVMEDDIALIDDRFYIVGRKDRSGGNGRKPAAKLISELDRGKYIIMLDHQPHDFDAEAEAGADLVLCGHTHGGQFIPITHVGMMIGENDLNYGHERRRNTEFIVSSGISNWAFKFKTGCFSEYTVIDIEGKP